MCLYLYALIRFLPVVFASVLWSFDVERCPGQVATERETEAGTKRCPLERQEQETGTEGLSAPLSVPCGCSGERPLLALAQEREMESVGGLSVAGFGWNGWLICATESCCWCEID